MTSDGRPRFVVLGASNVSLAIASIVALARGAHEGPIEILAAHGHGRSYGSASRVLFVRELPGIGTCGLWSAIDARRAPTTALVTDIGNDLAYGSAPGQVAEWIERDLDRLLAARARIVLTRMPLASLSSLGAARFAIVKAALFPFRAIVLEEFLEAARELDALIESLARERDIALVTPSGDWYGFDPIHVRRSMRAAASARILAPLFGAIHPRTLGRGELAVLGRTRPATRRFFGREQRCEQPCARFGDGSTVSWY